MDSSVEPSKSQGVWPCGRLHTSWFGGVGTVPGADPSAKPDKGEKMNKIISAKNRVLSQIRGPVSSGLNIQISGIVRIPTWDRLIDQMGDMLDNQLKMQILNQLKAKHEKD